MSRSANVSCSCFFLVLLFNVTVGGLLFDYVLWSILGKDVPWYADCLCGLFLGEPLVPAALVC